MIGEHETSIQDVHIFRTVMAKSLALNISSVEGQYG
jgi:hypothetical protein